MTKEQSKKVVSLTERQKCIMGAIADIVVFNADNKDHLPDYCTITISGILDDGKIYCVPKDIVLKTIDYLSMNLKAEKFSICGG